MACGHQLAGHTAGSPAGPWTAAPARDVDAVLAARGVDRALLVGWSYGAFVAAHWAGRNPDRTVGAVLVDGAQPYDWLDAAMEERIRKLFRRMGWFWPLLRPFGMAPRMTAEQQANSNIELGVISRERALGPVLDDITVPVRYVVASGAFFGSRGDEQERIRASLDGVTARNPNIRISAKVASNHGAILRKDFRAVAAAVREVAALDRGGAEDQRTDDRPDSVSLRRAKRPPQRSELGFWPSDRTGCRSG
ncbi:alpha/beta fold hydrolase [Nonomuraea angiospora]|uniref:alpha/beta fold hydrolase n=1 Tax=Nonomuraea angiospora TaxID=46172 RepID=UPI003F55BBE1